MTGAPIESPRPVRDSLRLRELTDALLLVLPRGRERGRRYAEEGRVGPVTRTGDAIRAYVQGTEQVLTSWEWNGAAWESDCTCPVGLYCKHAYALASVVLADARAAGGFDDPRLEDLLPPCAEERRPADVGRVARPRPEVAATAESRSAEAALEDLRSARSVWQRQSALDELLVGCPVATVNPYVPPLSDILVERDPDLACWRLAHEIRALSGGWLPSPLEPYLDRADIEDRRAGQARAAAMRELAAWGEARRRAKTRSLSLVLYLEPDAAGDAVITFEVRASGPRLDDEPRSEAQLQQMRTDARRNPGSYASEQARLLENLVEYGRPVFGSSARAPRFASSDLEALLEETASSAARWSEELDAGLARRAGIVPGGSVRLAARAARLVPSCFSRQGEPWVELAFTWPDGREVAFGDAVLVRGAEAFGGGHPLVVSAGEISRVVEQPPASLFAHLRELGGFAVPAAQRVALLTRLAEDFPHVRKALGAHARVHRVRPAMALDLRDNAWLQARLFAVSGSETWTPASGAQEAVLVFEYEPGAGWLKQTGGGSGQTAPGPYTALGGEDGQTPVAGEGAESNPTGTEGAEGREIWIEGPDPEQVADAVAWLDSLPFHDGQRRSPGGYLPPYEDRATGWWMRATQRRMEQIADAWEQRPEGMSFFGTEPVRRLLGPGQQARPRLCVTGTGFDWFTVAAEWEAEGRRLSEQDLARLRAASTRFVKLDSGWVRREEGAEQEAVAALLADLGLAGEEGEQKLTLWQLAGASPDTLDRLEEIGADPGTIASVRQLRERLAEFRGLPEVAVPSTVHAELRPYQRRGLDFLVYTAELALGAILADDMGLGKTLQALAWLVHLKEKGEMNGPCLVVCPASVAHNWLRETARFTPSLSVLLLGSGATRHELRQDVRRYDLVVTNYALLRRDIEAWREIELGAAVLDEAQFIKNPDAAVSRAARSLNARYRVALTGTPLENRALDLWSIASFVNPGYLGGRSRFQSQYDAADASAHTRALLGAKLRPVLLRRTKEEVAPDLPDRIEERYDCELGREQRQLYLAELRRCRAQVEDLAEVPGGLARNRVTVLAGLTRLRQICCHPVLAGGKPSLASGKFEALFELLEPLLAEGHKVLLFSQFVRCLKLLATEMSSRGIAHHMLTGRTVKREQVVNAFQEDPRPSVFLVSLRAGGTGLNLTSASYVVLFDPWWNPAVEAQAIDRTHRIGQDRTVIAYRMLTRGTVEEKIWELQERKSTLARDILGEGGFTRALSREDLDFLFAEA